MKIHLHPLGLQLPFISWIGIELLKGVAKSFQTVPLSCILSSRFLVVGYYYLGDMKFWQNNSGDIISIYYEPFKWERLISLFDENSLVTIEHFSGADKEQQTFFKSWYGCSPELIAMLETLTLKDLTGLIERYKLYPYEYILRTRSVRIERAVIEGAVFTGDSKTIQMLLDKLELPEAIRQTTSRGELVDLGESGKVQVAGTFGNSADLLEFIYNDLMAKESPGFDDFMDSLDSAVIVKD